MPEIVMSGQEYGTTRLSDRFNASIAAMSSISIEIQRLARTFGTDETQVKALDGETGFPDCELVDDHFLHYAPRATDPS